MQPLLGIDKGIVRLFRGKGEDRRHIGLGILVDDVTIVTCAHVVNGCLGRGTFNESAPEKNEGLKVSFPISGDNQEMAAFVIGWSPPGLAGLDCAVLKLDEIAPSHVGRANLTVLEKDDASDHELSIYGSLGLQNPGAHLSVKFAGAVGASWAQLSTTSDQSFQPGFSGGGVWDKTGKTCIGMVVALKSDSGGTVGYFLDASRISDEFGDLVPFERRRISVQRQKWFTAFALILFVLMLLHHLAQSNGATGLVPWAKGDVRLAAFFGAHCFAVLGPVLMWVAYTHARSFALRPMLHRVPAVFVKGPGASVDNTRLGATAVVVFLLVLPCLAQGRAMHEALFQQPLIYAHADSFQNETTPFHTCNVDNGTFCQHSDLGLWSVLALQPYFDHAYQIAGSDYCGESRCAVTFFPILQPAVLIAGTALAYGWFILFVFALVRPWPFQPSARHSQGD